MKARIYSPTKTAMQSGKAKTGHWVLEYEAVQPKTVEPLMGYTSSHDTTGQIRLTFPTLDDAVAYAEKNAIAYRVEMPKPAKRMAISYADNFRYDRKIPWTH